MCTIIHFSTKVVIKKQDSKPGKLSIMIIVIIIFLFHYRNILCFPISDNDEVIGVAELCNKQSGSHFTKFDEEMAMAFRYQICWKYFIGQGWKFNFQFVLWFGNITQLDVQKSGRCSVQIKTKQWIDDVSYEGKTQQF